MKSAIYCRVSTSDQNVDMQLRDLRRLAEQRGLETFNEYVDQGQSGGKTSRPALDEMLADARRGRFQVLLVWKLDRLGRNTSHLINLLQDFQAWNVQLISFSEGLDFTSASGRLFYALLSAFSEFERDCIRERVRAGLRAAKARGKRLGRPQVAIDSAAIAEMRASGMSLAAIAEKFGCSTWLIHSRSKSAGREAA